MGLCHHISASGKTADVDQSAFPATSGIGVAQVAGISLIGVCTSQWSSLLEEAQGYLTLE